MKIKVLNQKAQEKNSVELPSQFKENTRLDLIKRAVQAIQANNRQRYGAKEDAGKRHSAYLSKRRRAYRGTYGIGQSRTPRKVMSRSGIRFNYVGAVAPQTVGGRRAHPPKASKVWSKSINKKENQKAIRSALSSTMNKELVTQRGHQVPSNFPFIITDDFTKIKKTSELKEALNKIGFEQELKRAEKTKVRPGKGKNRGRKYKKKTSILFVVTEPCELASAAANIPGCTTILVEDLNAYSLAPGTQPGRLTLYTESAIKKISQEKLFTNKEK